MSQLGRRALSGAITALAGARVTGPDGETDVQLPEQAIFFANHSSHLDFLTIWAALPWSLQRRTRPIAAKDYWDKGVRRHIVEGVFRAYLVERHGGGGGRSTGSGVSPKGQLTGMTDVLDGGDSLIIFPEGTRGDGQRIADFHGGLYRLAVHDRGIPVIPVTLVNLGRILPKGESIPVPHLSTLEFGDPLSVGEGEDQADFLARARGVLVDTLERHAGSVEDSPSEDAPSVDSPSEDTPSAGPGGDSDITGDRPGPSS